MFKVGQFVYTSRDIVGWWDFSHRHCIPAGTVGNILKIDDSDNSNTKYSVYFGPEFKEVIVPEKDLKLG